MRKRRGSCLFPSFYPSLQHNCWRYLKTFSSFSTLSSPQLHMGCGISVKVGRQSTWIHELDILLLSLGNSEDYFHFFCLFFSFTSKILDTQNTQDSSFHLFYPWTRQRFYYPLYLYQCWSFLMDTFHPPFSFIRGMLKLPHSHGSGLEGPTTHPISQRKNIPHCELSCSQLCIILCMQLFWAMQTSQNFSVSIREIVGIQKHTSKTTNGIFKYSQQAYFQTQIPSENCTVVTCITFLFKKLWTLKHKLFIKPAAIFPFFCQP